jgi:hypothetical protein
VHNWKKGRTLHLLSRSDYNAVLRMQDIPSNFGWDSHSAVGCLAIYDMTIKAFLRNCLLSCDSTLLKLSVYVLTLNITHVYVCTCIYAYTHTHRYSFKFLFSVLLANFHGVHSSALPCLQSWLWCDLIINVFLAQSHVWYLVQYCCNVLNVPW